MKIKRKTKTLLGAVTIGAVLAYLLDPAAGRRRRDRMVGMAERRASDMRHLVKNVRQVADVVTPASDEVTTSDQATTTQQPQPEEADTPLGETEYPATDPRQPQTAVPAGQ